MTRYAHVMHTKTEKGVCFVIIKHADSYKFAAP